MFSRWYSMVDFNVIVHFCISISFLQHDWLKWSSNHDRASTCFTDGCTHSLSGFYFELFYIQKFQISCFPSLRQDVP